MIGASFQKKMYFTIIIREMTFYCSLLDWRTCTVCSGKVSVCLLKISWDILEEIFIDMTGSRIVTNKKIESISKGTLILSYSASASDKLVVNPWRLFYSL